jgi:hypothetical protein
MRAFAYQADITSPTLVNFTVDMDKGTNVNSTHSGDHWGTVITWTHRQLSGEALLGGRFLLTKLFRV